MSKYYKETFLRCAARKSLVSFLLILISLWCLIRVSVPIMAGYLIVAHPLHSADALIVMAGSMSERLPAAAELYKKKVANKILLTNDGVSSAFSIEKQRNLYEVEWAETYLISSGVPEKAIFKLSYTSSGTIYDVLNTRAAVQAAGIKSIIIVTSDYHTRRSHWVFKRVFKDYPVTVGVFPVESRVATMSTVRKFMVLGYEMLKLLYYNCRYRNI
jgi:uncharacterized SAM-binding protein YcdF (DUF218 family)